MQSSPHFLRLGIVGWKLRGKKGLAFCPELILDWFNPFLHDWHYSIPRASLGLSETQASLLPVVLPWERMYGPMKHTYPLVHGGGRCKTPEAALACLARGSDVPPRRTEGRSACRATTGRERKPPASGACLSAGSAAPRSGAATRHQTCGMPLVRGCARRDHGTPRCGRTCSAHRAHSSSRPRSFPKANLNIYSNVRAPGTMLTPASNSKL